MIYCDLCGKEIRKKDDLCEYSVQQRVYNHDKSVSRWIPLDVHLECWKNLREILGNRGGLTMTECIKGGTIGMRIRRLRKSCGMTQAELAGRIGTAASMIGQWENGNRKPKLCTLSKIALACNAPVSVLIDDVIPVKHGMWNEYEDDFGESMVYQCSVCKNEFVFTEGSPKDNGYCYCPSCGARLDYDDE